MKISAIVLGAAVACLAAITNGVARELASPWAKDLHTAFAGAGEGREKAAKAHDYPTWIIDELRETPKRTEGNYGRHQPQR